MHLRQNANTEAANGDGWTPLNIAAESSHVEVVKLLLENGADTESANKDGWNAIGLGGRIWLCRGSEAAARKRIELGSCK